VTSRTGLPILAAVLFAAAPSALAQEKPPAPPPAEEVPPRPGSADDVNFELDTARPRPAGLLPNGPVSLLDPQIDRLNAYLKKEVALEVGLAYTAVYQDVSDGALGHGEAGDGDVFARWRLLGEEKGGWRGILGANAEGRHDFGDATPRDLGDSFGSLWRTTNTFGRQEFDLIQLWWEQHLFDDRVVVTAGKMDPDNYYNTNRYQSDSTAFLSRAFSANPARFHPSNGLGANAKGKIAGDFYALVGFQDANAVKTDSPFETVDEGDWWGAIEGGWTPKFEKLGKGAYRLTAWTVEALRDAGVPSDHGYALSCDQEVGRGFVPFFRAAIADGDVTGVDRFVCGGVGLEGVFGTDKDLTGFGLSYGEPSDAVRDSQWGGEVFHRFQVSPDIQFTIGYQYIHSPADDTVAGDDPVHVFELRVRVTF